MPLTTTTPADASCPAERLGQLPPVSAGAPGPTIVTVVAVRAPPAPLPPPPAEEHRGRVSEVQQPGGYKPSCRQQAQQWAPRIAVRRARGSRSRERSRKSRPSRPPTASASSSSGRRSSSPGRLPRPRAEAVLDPLRQAADQPRALQAAVAGAHGPPHRSTRRRRLSAECTCFLVSARRRPGRRSSAPPAAPGPSRARSEPAPGARLQRRLGLAVEPAVTAAPGVPSRRCSDRGRAARSAGARAAATRSRTASEPSPGSAASPRRWGARPGPGCRSGRRGRR